MFLPVFLAARRHRPGPGATLLELEARSACAGSDGAPLARISALLAEFAAFPLEAGDPKEEAAAVAAIAASDRAAASAAKRALGFWRRAAIALVGPGCYPAGIAVATGFAAEQSLDRQAALALLLGALPTAFAASDPVLLMVPLGAAGKAGSKRAHGFRRDLISALPFAAIDLSGPDAGSDGGWLMAAPVSGLPLGAASLRLAAPVPAPVRAAA